MPASLPGSTAAQNATNPSAGQVVLLSPMSGPKGSPFDRPGSAQSSTGGLNVGIGFGANHVIGLTPGLTTAPLAIRAGGFTEDYTVGDKRAELGATPSVPVSAMTLIGGGKAVISNPTREALSVNTPYTAGTLILMAGNGGSRDAGVGPDFTGFTTKMVTTVGTVANGVVIETGWNNRSGVTLTVNQSVDGSSTAASAAPV